MIKFLKEFVKNPTKVGAILPSSKYLAECMVSEIDFLNCECIVEYGAGTGVFTEKIISRKKEETKLLVFEKNKSFYDHLSNLYKCQKNVIIINDGAENLKNYLSIYKIKNVGFIVSGLPFASLPKELSNNILQTTKDVMNNKSKFITFQYMKIKKGLFLKYFDNIDIDRVYLNMPPAYVFRFNKS